MNGNDLLLQADRLSRRSTDGVVLIDAATLRLRAGERVVVEGPTGAGKTVLLRALALLDPLDDGQVRWQGLPVADAVVPAFRSRVVYLHQSPALAEGTVEDNLRAPFALRAHRERRYDRARAEARFATLGRRAEFLGKAMGDLSGGERQVTALVRVLLLDPQVLLLDEPTAALDPDTTSRAEKLLDDWVGEAPEARAYIWVSHDREQAVRVAGRRLYMAAGRLGDSEGGKTRAP